MSVWDAVVERNDVIWFAVEDVGLVRWDLNGSAGPDDTLTWHDQSDDVWSTPVAEFPGSGNDAEKVKGLALAPDGTIWAGGNGLVRFSYDADTGETTVHESWSEKTSSFADGLVNGSVSDVVVDGNGDCWVASATGLNRIRTRGTVTTVDTWIDLRNFYGNSLYQLLYSPNVVAALPGISYDPYGKLAVDRTGLRVAVTADQGAALLSIVRYNAGQSDETITAYCYPNPVTPGTGDDQLMLGGIAADAAADDPATVEIYNLEGQLVYRDRYVTAGVGFWDGNNRYGRPVAAGVYLVRVTWRGSHAVHNLAVVR